MASQHQGLRVRVCVESLRSSLTGFAFTSAARRVYDGQIDDLFSVHIEVAEIAAFLIILIVGLLLIYRLSVAHVGDLSFPALQKFTQIDRWAIALTFWAFSLSALIGPMLLKSLPAPPDEYVGWGLLATALLAPLTGPAVLLYARYQFTWDRALRLTATIQFLIIVYVTVSMPFACLIGALLAQTD